MHAEGGWTIERRSGTRAATTFKKLPRASPGAKKKAAIAASTDSLSAASTGSLSPAKKRLSRRVASYPEYPDGGSGGASVTIAPGVPAGISIKEIGRASCRERV